MVKMMINECDGMLHCLYNFSGICRYVRAPHDDPSWCSVNVKILDWRKDALWFGEIIRRSSETSSVSVRAHTQGKST